MGSWTVFSEKVSTLQPRKPQRVYLGQEASRATQRGQVYPDQFAQVGAGRAGCFHLAAECSVKKGHSEIDGGEP